jgi:hypothetical protein
MRFHPGTHWRIAEPTTDLCGHCGRTWCAFHSLHRDECPCIGAHQKLIPETPCVACDGDGKWHPKVTVPEGQEPDHPEFKP